MLKLLLCFHQWHQPPEWCAACAKQFRTLPDLAEKLGMDVTDLMRQC